MNQYIVVQFLNKLFIILNERKIMSVFSELFNDFTGWLTVGVIVFMLVMMAYLFSMFISKSAKGKK